MLQSFFVRWYSWERVCESLFALDNKLLNQTDCIFLYKNLALRVYDQNIYFFVRQVLSSIYTNRSKII